MKKRLALAATLLLLITGFTACKKENESTKPLRSKIIGKWQVNKIEITTFSASGAAETTSTTYTSSDYLDFKDNESDDFELALTTRTVIGSFSTAIGNKLFLDFTDRDLDCNVTTITDNQLQFVGTVTGANPKITETYFLSR